MNQVKCPDCGEVYSENMQSCPNCGCPNDNWKPKQEEQVHETTPTDYEEDFNEEWSVFSYLTIFMVIHRSLAFEQLSTKGFRENIHSWDGCLVHGISPARMKARRKSML